MPQDRRIKTDPASTPLMMSTADAARALNRRAQTLRQWACQGRGPIRPLHVGGRLLWPRAEVCKLLGVPE